LLFRDITGVIRVRDWIIRVRVIAKGMGLGVGVNVWVRVG